MDTNDDFIKLITKVFRYLPRYIELSDKSVRTKEEEKELKDIMSEIKNIRKEIFRIIPEFTNGFNKYYFEYYYDLNRKTVKMNSGNHKNSQRKYIYQMPFLEWLEISQN